MSVLKSKNVINVEKSMSEILNLKLCQAIIPNNEITNDSQIVIIESENCCINTNTGDGCNYLSLYGNKDYGFNKTMNHDIDCVILKIKINHSYKNDGSCMFLGVAESDYIESYNKGIFDDKGKEKENKDNVCIKQM